MAADPSPELLALRSLVKGQTLSLGPASAEVVVEQLLFRARREGLEGVLLGALSGSSREAGEAIKSRFLETCEWRSLALKIGRRFAEQNVSAVVFKGGSLMWSLYPKAWMRPISDLDFLVYEEQWPEIKELCRELEFVARTDCYSGFFTDNGYAVDIHFSPLNQMELGYPIPRELFWSEVEDFEEFPGLSRFSPEMELLVVTLHGLKHSFDRLIWLADAALLLPRIDPKKMSDLLDKVGAVRAFVYLEYLLASILQSQMPPGLLKKVRLSWWEKRHLVRISERKATPWLGMLLPFFCVTTLGQRVRYLKRLLAPTQLSLRDRLRRVIRLLLNFFRDLFLLRN